MRLFCILPDLPPASVAIIRSASGPHVRARTAAYMSIVTGRASPTPSATDLSCNGVAASPKLSKDALWCTKLTAIRLMTTILRRFPTAGNRIISPEICAPVPRSAPQMDPRCVDNWQQSLHFVGKARQIGSTAQLHPSRRAAVDPFGELWNARAAMSRLPGKQKGRTVVHPWMSPMRARRRAGGRYQRNATPSAGPFNVNFSIGEPDLNL